MGVIIFLIVAVVALIHFIYQGILLPSYRLEMRIRLFALRDKLRRLKAESPNLDEEAFSLVQGCINHWVHHTGFDLFILMKVKNAVEKDKQLQDRLAKRAARIEQGDSEELKGIAKEVRQTLEQVVFLNSGALFIYLVPVAVLLACFQRIATAVRWLVCMSAWEVNQFAPEESLA